jgi:hypothetical protein
MHGIVQIIEICGEVHEIIDLIIIEFIVEHIGDLIHEVLQ